MLRMLVFTLMLGVFVTGFASAEEPQAPGVRQFAASAIDMPVVADDGTVQGRVRHVQRDAQGHVVAAMVDGLEAPADAPRPMVVAENDGRRTSDLRVSSVPAGTFSR